MKNKIFYIVMLVLILGVIGYTSYRAYNDFFKDRNKPEEPAKVQLDSLELYGYVLNDTDTEVYKKYFNELKEALNKEEVDEKEYASLIVKLFITDYYTLSNKISSSDIGGLDFIHPEMKENFIYYSGNTIYNHVKTNLNGDRDQKLPTISEVVIDGCEHYDYPLHGEYVDGYKVSASWTFAEDMGYETSGNFYVIKNENKLYIVEK